MSLQLGANFFKLFFGSTNTSRKSGNIISIIDLSLLLQNWGAYFDIDKKYTLSLLVLIVDTELDCQFYCNL